MGSAPECVICYRLLLDEIRSHSVSSAMVEEMSEYIPQFYQ